ncbi:hypothetical protein [Luteimonas terricola]|uniref:Uncharacterized protein n=1 Tax=Luteimonas terricola TaxID=645597 RepID=A0ABQ2EEA4_9GAMM|nr:hypothetical protein [Luteimonas terricola]GGK08510.1 hypothetical protein GCM10011394_17370 [Luteimonas terricola]
MDPGTWFYIAMLVVSLVVQVAMRPKIEHAKPLSIDDLNVPGAEEGRDISVVFGTCWIEDFNVLDYGDLRNEPPIKASGGK